MKHKKIYDEVILQLETIHSRNPSYIPKTEKVPLGNGNSHYWSKGGTMGFHPPEDNRQPSPQPSAAILSPTGLGDMGMKTSFEAVPVGEKPVISKGMPVGYPKKSFAEFMMNSEPEFNPVEPTAVANTVRSDVPRQAQMYIDKAMKTLKSKRPRDIQAAVGNMQQQAAQNLSDRGASYGKRFARQQLGAAKDMKKAL